MSRISTNQVVDRLKELIRDIEQTGLLSIDIKNMTLFGYSIPDIKKFIDFGKSRKFNPKEKLDEKSCQ